MKVSYLIIAGIMVVSLYACKHNSEESVLPVSQNTGTDTIPITCDTDDVSYKRDISVILANNCYSCHSGKGATAGLQLEDYQVVNNLALDEGGDLLNSVNGTPDHVYMPPAPQSKLSSCEITKIAKWVRQGALNN